MPLRVDPLAILAISDRAEAQIGVFDLGLFLLTRLVSWGFLLMRSGKSQGGLQNRGSLANMFAHCRALSSLA